MSTHQYVRSVAPDGHFDLATYARPESVESRIEQQLPARAFTTKATGTVFDVIFEDVLDAGETTLLDNTVTAYIADVVAGLLPVPTSDTSTPVQVINTPSVHVRKPSGLTTGRVYGFSVNFCDKTTWYHDAIEVIDEAVGTGDGAATTFNLAHGTNADAGERIIDLSHGKVSDENNLPNQSGNFRQMGSGYGNTYPYSLSGYVPVVKIDGVEQTERAYGEVAGGDYTIDYTTGEITFFVAPANGLGITVTYWYVPAAVGPKVRIVPSTGKRYMIDRVEIQSSPDSCPKSDIVMGVYAGAAPPNGVLIERPTIVKNIYDIVNWAYGSRPQIEIQGGGATRALTHQINIHQVLYATEVPLLSSSLMYMEVSLAQPVEFDGTWATVVIYGVEEDE